MHAWAGEVPDAATAREALRHARPVLQDMRRRAASEAQPASGSGNSSNPGGGAGENAAAGDAFQPRWPLECHFSAEYLDDLLAQVDAALGAQAGGSGGGADRQGATAASAALPEASASASGLLTPNAHALYAAAASAVERASLADAADQLLQDGALQAQPAGVVRSHWLLRLQLEWEALADQSRSASDVLQRWEQRRAQRRWVGRWGFAMLSAFTLHRCRRITLRHQCPANTPFVCSPAAPWRG